MACRDAGATKVCEINDMLLEKELRIFFKITTVDINNGKLEIARKFEATHTINASK